MVSYNQLMKTNNTEPLGAEAARSCASAYVHNSFNQEVNIAVLHMGGNKDQGKFSHLTNVIHQGVGPGFEPRPSNSTTHTVNPKLYHHSNEPVEHLLY